MKTKINDQSKSEQRRQRLHELLIALIQVQDSIELLDGESPSLDSSSLLIGNQDPAMWIDKNRRILVKYQSLVRSAVTLDALIDSEKIDSV